MRVPLDLSFVRSQFPAFSEPSLRGVRYFENAGGSYACRQTIERLSRYYTQTKLQPYLHHPAGRVAAEAMDEGRARLAALLNVGADELHVGPSTTQNTYVLAHAFRAGWSPGDEVIVTDQDHEANIGAWRRLAATGIVVKEWSADPDSGRLDPAALDALLTPRTRLVAFTHCSNLVGQINPVAEITSRVRAAGARSVVDGVAYAPHGLPDVDALGSDVYLFSAYKTYGPHQGVMVVRRPVMPELANQSHGFNDGVIAKRLVPAGPDHAQVAALAGIADYLDALHAHHFGGDAEPAERARRVHDAMRAHEQELLAPLLEFSARRYRVLGPTDARERAPTVSLAVREDPQALARALGDRGFAVGCGHFYAPRLLRRMGVDPERGVLRISFTHYTDRAEVEGLMEALETVGR